MNSLYKYIHTWPKVRRDARFVTLSTIQLFNLVGYRIYYLLCLGIIVCLFSSIGLFGIGLPLLPIQQVEADTIDFNEKILTLTGNVSVTHEIGIIHCNTGLLHLNNTKAPTNDLAVQTIFLHENVIIDLSDGSQLRSDEGQLDCLTMEGIFTSHPPAKVVYLSYAQDSHKKIPIRASSRILKAKIIKTPQGYTLSSLKGEGATTIEYLNPLEETGKKQEQSE